MKVLFYEGDHDDKELPHRKIEDMVAQRDPDDLTAELELCDIAHVETEDGETTLYTIGAHLYIVLDDDDVEAIYQSYLNGSMVMRREETPPTGFK